MQTALREKWDLLEPEVAREWPGIPPEDLHQVDGGFERLVALVQFHYGLTEQEARDQVESFMERLPL